MTTEVQVRDAIVAYFNPAWVLTYPTVQVFYENAVKVDLDAVGSSFLRVMIEFTDSVRQGLDLAPHTASYGEVILQLFSKEGQGTRDSLVKLNYLRELLKYHRLTGVDLDCPRFGRKQSRNGWTSQDLIVPFYFFQ